MCVGSGIDLAKAFHKKLKPNITPSKLISIKDWNSND